MAGHVWSQRRAGAHADAFEMLAWLALHTGDQDLLNLVWRALNSERRLAEWRAKIVTVSQPVVGYDIAEGEVRLRLGEASIVRWRQRDDENRAHHWRRIFMYLAGHQRAASLSRLGIDGAPALYAALVVEHGDAATNHGVLYGWGSLVPPHRPPLDREPPTSFRGRNFHEYLAEVERRRDAAWSEVWWTMFGSQERQHYSRLRPPRGVRARRGAVRRQLLAADRAARAWVAPRISGRIRGEGTQRTRMRLDDYAVHVVAHLLLDGFGTLPPYPLVEATAAFAGCGHGEDAATALYKHRDAARRLIARWETVGTE
jgi:hypothetical protein